ncbi:MAG: Zn-ribbon domain-containing OB-fold protein [Candidatus Diapherotrites archaeon]|nr:Zn-ribbon domain-containing OB-fold protein [Candidatus Diapherotrites archaeon]
MIWRRIPERYRLEGTRCATCGRYFFPPRSFCPDCRRKGRIEKATLSGKGKVYTYTVVHVPLEGFERYAPYILAIVELDEGPKITAQIVDAEPNEIAIGMPVEMHFRRVSEDGETGIIHYGFKFAPIKA